MVTYHSTKNGTLTRFSKQKAVQYYLRKGLEARKNGNYLNAIGYFTKCIKIRPTAAFYKNRALAKYESGDYTSALKDVNKTFSLNFNNIHNTECLIVRSMINYELRKYNHVIKDCTRILAICSIKTNRSCGNNSEKESTMVKNMAIRLLTFVEREKKINLQNCQKS